MSYPRELEVVRIEIPDSKAALEVTVYDDGTIVLDSGRKEDEEYLILYPQEMVFLVSIFEKHKKLIMKQVGFDLPEVPDEQS